MYLKPRLTTFFPIFDPDEEIDEFYLNFMSGKLFDGFWSLKIVKRFVGCTSLKLIIFYLWRNFPTVIVMTEMEVAEAHLMPDLWMNLALDVDVEVLEPGLYAGVLVASLRRNRDVENDEDVELQGHVGDRVAEPEVNVAVVLVVVRERLIHHYWAEEAGTI